MSDKKFKMDEASQAIADEMINAARAERRTKESARRFVKMLKIIAFFIVVIVVYFLVSPYISGGILRDNDRKKTATSVMDEINSYKVSHRNNLPMEGSRRQWQKELIEKYLIGKDFNIEPKSKAEYYYEVNYKKPASDIKQSGGLQAIFIDQSARCGADGELETAGNNIAAVRILLESGQLHCVDNN